jgi:thiol-disulfide isomerase/thioredoxin
LEGVDEVRTAPEAALQKYSEGKHLFWSREAQEGEYTWENLKCNECFMSPLIGSRYGCTNEDCRINLCQLCLTKNQHEHPLMEYFIPKQHYSLEKLFSSIPYLLAPKKGENIPIKDILQNDLKSIGLYFSAHWCPPCKHFTPKLAEIYQQAQINSKSFEIIFISCDRDEESFDNYRSEMPWPSAPLNSTTLLKAYFQLSGKENFFAF